MTSPSLAEIPLTGEAVTFRHFPAENENVHPTGEPFASNPKLASILRCSTHANPLAMVSDPLTPVLLEGDPVRAIPGSVSIVLDDVMTGTWPPQPVLVAEGEPSYASFGDIFWEERSERMAGPESNLGFALSGLTHLGPVRNALKHTRASISGSSFRQDHSQWSARSKSKHDERSQSFRGPAKIISPEKSDEGISSTPSSFSVTTRSSQGPDGPIVTMRFEHRQDENGHHVLIGREGELTRCEDEPIRVPGAVQGFGVLMVLHDDRITGKLPVRQVSEVSLFFKQIKPISISSRIAM